MEEKVTCKDFLQVQIDFQSVMEILVRISSKKSHLIRILILSLFIICYGHSQNDSTIITQRDNIPIQAVINVQQRTNLYVGQEYTFETTTSGSLDVFIKVKNGTVKLIENSKRSTGGLRYTLIPKSPGICSISIGNKLDDDRKVYLLANNYKVYSIPEPIISINSANSGDIISELTDSSRINCTFPSGTGLKINLIVKSWEITIGNRIFKGMGSVITQDLVEYLKTINDKIMLITVELEENETEYLSSKGHFSFINKK